MKSLLYVKLTHSKMSQIPLAPPPPMPMPTIIKKESKLNNTVESCFSYSKNNSLCIWASEHLELRDACIKNRLCLMSPPFKVCFTHFQSILQEGPTCGLVALSMLIKGQVQPEELLDMAKKEGYTKNGEMFSCTNMLRLTEDVFKCLNINAEVRILTDGILNEKTIDALMNKAVLLVPYDADFNHAPCLRNGHKAHWVLITGILVLNEYTEQIPPAKDIFVFGKHGKSRHLAVWGLEELQRSNQNLWEFSPKRDSDDAIYIVPDGGVGGDDGLRNKFLIIDGLKY